MIDHLIDNLPQLKLLEDIEKLAGTVRMGTLDGQFQKEGLEVGVKPMQDKFKAAATKLKSDPTRTVENTTVILSDFYTENIRQLDATLWAKRTELANSVDLSEATISANARLTDSMEQASGFRLIDSLEGSRAKLLALSQKEPLVYKIALSDPVTRSKFNLTDDDMSRAKDGFESVTLPPALKQELDKNRRLVTHLDEYVLHINELHDKISKKTQSLKSRLTDKEEL